MWLRRAARADALGARRRYLAGPDRLCGLCGIESLTEAVRSPPRVREGHDFAAGDIMRAIESLAPLQEINRQTRAVHAAAFWEAGAGLVALREDVGRHNAPSTSLLGALAREHIPGQTGLILLTSRVSVEMVQKAAVIGVPVLVAISAPTALAVHTAEAAGITLVAVGGADDGFEVFAHPRRIIKEATAHVA